jgi:CRISPR-associated endonuclease Csn1
MQHSQEARPSGELKAKNGAYKNQEDFRSKITMLHTQIKALVEGYDFNINDIGEIKMLR